MPELARAREWLDLAAQVRAWGSPLLRLIERLRRQPPDPAPGDAQARAAAYRRLQEAVARCTLSLQLLAALGTPPRLRGAIWTWPIALRAIRCVRDDMNEAVVATLEIALVGSNDVLTAALRAGEALGRLATQFPARRALGPPTAFKTEIDSVNGALADFVAAARADLQTAK